MDEDNKSLESILLVLEAGRALAGNYSSRAASYLNDDSRPFSGDIAILYPNDSVTIAAESIEKANELAGKAKDYQEMVESYASSRVGKAVSEYVERQGGPKGAVWGVGAFEEYGKKGTVGMAIPDYASILFSKDLHRYAAAVSDAYNVPEKYVLEYIITHEVFHNALDIKDEEVLEAYLADFFDELAYTSESPEEMSNYIKIAKLARDRKARVKENYRSGMSVEELVSAYRGCGEEESEKGWELSAAHLYARGEAGAVQEEKEPLEEGDAEGVEE